MVKIPLLGLPFGGGWLLGCTGDAGDTDDVGDDVLGTFTLNVTPDNDVAPYTVTFEGQQHSGSWEDNPPGPLTVWGVVAIGPNNRQSVALIFVGEPGVDSYAVGSGVGSSGIFTDLVTFGSEGTFQSQSGTLEVTRWEASTESHGYDTYVLDGTFDVQFSNELADANRVDVHVEGEFMNLVMFDLRSAL
jgi:hypothetical protein